MNFHAIEPGRPIRIAFLGCGNVTRKHSKTLKGFQGVELYFASRTEEKAAEYSRKWGGKGFFGTYQAAMEAPEIDAVFVATPPDSHLTLALAALRAGKHVIVEKPPFLKSADFDMVAAESQKTGRQVMVAENYFYKPLLQRLRQILASGAIGELKFMVFNATKTQKTGDWRDVAGLTGGGAFFEGGIHWVNFLSNLGLDIRSAQGFLPGKKDAIGSPVLERSFQLVVQFEQGPVATLLYSWEINTLLFGLRLSRIYGTAGSVTFESNGVFVFVRGKKWRFSLLPGLSNIDGSRLMFQDFLNALRSGNEPSFSLSMAKRDIELIEKAYSSAGYFPT